MKLSKIIALILAIVCCVSLLASCDIDGEGNGDGSSFDPSKMPKTPKEHYEYAVNYMMSNAYKQTIVTSSEFDGETYSDESLSYMDGTNYINFEDNATYTYFDGTIYADSPNGKKKMEIDMDEFAESLGVSTDYLNEMSAMLTDDNIKMTKNADGTTTLEFSIELPVLGPTDYVMTLDKNARLVKYTVTSTMTIAGFTTTTVDDITVEYGDQYKVYPPADADAYVVVNSYEDLVM